MWRLILDDDLYKAPLKQPKYVLDLGTGSGIWAMDFGQWHHPRSLSLANVFRSHNASRVLGPRHRSEQAGAQQVRLLTLIPSPDMPLDSQVYQRPA